MKTMFSILFGLLILLCTRESHGESETKDSNMKCPPGNFHKDLTGVGYSDLSTGLKNSDVLRQSGEPSINDGNSDIRTIRVSVKPTFGKPVILKMYQTASGESFIAVKRLSGLGGYELGHIEMIGQISITKEYFDSVFVQANDVNLIGLSKMTLEQRLLTGGLDGCWWSVEILSDKKLKIIDLHSPRPLSEDATGLSPYLTKKAVAALIKLVADISDPVGILIDGVNRQ